MRAETVSLQTLDGVNLEVDLVRTDVPSPRAVVIVAHPHPQHGGDRHNHVVASVQRAASTLGCHSVAPDFRGVGHSTGTYDGGDAERLDLAAACELADMVEPECPIIMAGYSFGAAVALNVTHPAIAAWLAIAPPMSMMASEPLSARSHRPKVLVAPEHDQFADHADVQIRVAGWSNTRIDVVPGADHFFMSGALEPVQQALATCLTLI